MTTSEYSYATVANIEAFTGIDYSTKHATKFTDVLIEAKITIAEKMINSYLGKDGALTITDGIEACTIIIAAKILHNSLIEIGIHDKEEHSLEIIEMSIGSILRMFLGYDAGVDAIPMSGAD